VAKGAFGVVFKVCTKSDNSVCYALKVLKKSKVVQSLMWIFVVAKVQSARDLLCKKVRCYERKLDQR